MASEFKSSLFNGPKIDPSKPPAAGKKRVVLAWNEHPSESPVAGLHARRVANLLHSQYGHLYEIIVHKIPFKETNMGIVRSNLNKTQKKKALSNLLESRQLASKLAEKYGAEMCYNFHTSDFLAMYMEPQTKPQDYAIFTFSRDEPQWLMRLLGGGLSFCQNRGSKDTVIEIPTIRIVQPRRLVSKYRKIADSLQPWLPFSKKAYLRHRNLEYNYQELVTKRNDSSHHSADLIVSQKIAEEIHKQMHEKQIQKLF